MESLLRMSGLLTEEEAGRTDLGTLEKRLAEKASSRENATARTSSPAPSRVGANSQSESPQRPSSQPDTNTTPRDAVTSPSSDSDKLKSSEVENLSEAMCSLVTNNVGETRYIGLWSKGNPISCSH